jgi:AraC-like DNA-binding protein
MAIDEFIINDYEPSRKIDFKFPMLFKPCRELEPYISCYWLVAFAGTKDEARKLKPQTTVLIPDGGTSFVFNVHPNHEGNLWGLMDHPVVVDNQLSVSQGKRRTFGVDFNPAGLYRFYNMPMKEFVNVSPGLEAVSVSLFHEVTERITQARSLGEQIRLIELFLLQLLTNANPLPPVVSESLQLINKTAGNVLIRDLADKFLVSERHLNRLFQECVGISPKSLSRITRLQRVIKLCREDKQTDFLMAAYDNGYFDQAHFIKDFKEFCGCTPGKYTSG